MEKCQQGILTAGKEATLHTLVPEMFFFLSHYFNKLGCFVLSEDFQDGSFMLS
jgi:hypothetical protein